MQLSFIRKVNINLISQYGLHIGNPANQYKFLYYKLCLSFLKKYVTQTHIFQRICYQCVCKNNKVTYENETCFYETIKQRRLQNKSLTEKQLFLDTTEEYKKWILFTLSRIFQQFNFQNKILKKNDNFSMWCMKII